MNAIKLYNTRWRYTQQMEYGIIIYNDIIMCVY